MIYVERKSDTLDYRKIVGITVKVSDMIFRSKACNVLDWFIRGILPLQHKIGLLA